MKQPLADRQQEPPAGTCSCCGGELYGWELVYVLEGELVCQDCLTDYAKERFAPDLWVLADWNGRLGA